MAEKLPKGGAGGRNSPVIGNNGLRVGPGDNSKFASIVHHFGMMDPIDKTDLVALNVRLGEYLEYCAENDVPVGNQMCYMALGLNKDDVYDIEHGRKYTSAHSDFIKKVKSICAANRELLMSHNKVHPSAGIFWQKNYDGMRDVQDIVLTPNSPLGQMPDSDELRDNVNKFLPAGDFPDDFDPQT